MEGRVQIFREELEDMREQVCMTEEDIDRLTAAFKADLQIRFGGDGAEAATDADIEGEMADRAARVEAAVYEDEFVGQLHHADELGESFAWEQFVSHAAPHEDELVAHLIGSDRKVDELDQIEVYMLATQIAAHKKSCVDHRVLFLGEGDDPEPRIIVPSERPFDTPYTNRDEGQKLEPAVIFGETRYPQKQTIIYLDIMLVNGVLRWLHEHFPSTRMCPLLWDGGDPANPRTKKVTDEEAERTAEEPEYGQRQASRFFGEFLTKTFGECSLEDLCQGYAELFRFGRHPHCFPSELPEPE